MPRDHLRENVEDERIPSYTPRGWTIYEDGVVGNPWVVRFAREQRCRSFTEWWMAEDA